MASTYVNDLRLEEIGTGDQSGTWGNTTNLNLELIGEALGYATQQVFSSDADATTTIADGASDPARAMYFKITSAGSLTATRTCTIAPNTISRVMFIENATSGSQSIAISQGSGASVTILTGKTAVVYLDGAGAGAAVVDAMLGVDPGVTDTLTEVLVAGNTSGGTNIELSTTDKVQFRDTDIYLNSSVDGQLDIVADTEIQIAATTVDLNGDLDVSGTTLVTGVLTTTAATVFNGGFASNADSTLGTDKKVQFRDSAIYINSSVDGQLDIVADTEIQIAATTIDIDGAINASGEIIAASLDISGDIDVDGTANLDVVDIDGAVDMASTLAVGTRVGIGVAAHASAALHITTTDQHIRFSNGSELGVIELDSDGELNIWAHGDNETINLRTGSGSGTDVLSVVGSDVGIGTPAPESIVHIKDSGNVSTILQIESAASQYAPVINFDGIVGASADYLLGEINGSWDTHTNVVSAIRFESGADTTNKDDGLISFWTSSSGPTLTERMRIRSDGFVGIGNGGLAATRLSVTNSVVGVNIETTSATAAHEALIVNRQNSDGIAIAINKAGATVGSIGANGGRPYLVNNVDGGIHLSTDGYGRALLLPADQNGAPEDNLHYLGSPSYRWRDLYLSGGVVFGDAGGSGTPASNTLDSYEEGTWTPTLISIGYTFAYSNQEGIYTKIGNMVSVKLYLKLSGAPTGSGVNVLRIGSLPFTCLVGNASYGAGSILVENSDNLFAGVPTIRSNPSTTYLSIYDAIAGSSPASTYDCSKLDSNDEFEVSVVYHTA
jgi:cytoskeletal protein CcmA (bactofilin family)